MKRHSSVCTCSRLSLSPDRSTQCKTNIGYGSYGMNSRNETDALFRNTAATKDERSARRRKAQIRKWKEKMNVKRKQKKGLVAVIPSPFSPLPLTNHYATYKDLLCKSDLLFPSLPSPLVLSQSALPCDSYKSMIYMITPWSRSDRLLLTYKQLTIMISRHWLITDSSLFHIHRCFLPTQANACFTSS